ARRGAPQRRGRADDVRPERIPKREGPDQARTGRDAFGDLGHRPPRRPLGPPRLLLARFRGMTDLVSVHEIPAERSIAWRVAHDARVRYVVLVAALAGAYYGAAQIGYTLKFTG